MRALKAWRETGRPHVMVYFKTAPYSPASQTEHEQWVRVRSLRDNFPPDGLWGSFKSRAEFEAQLRRDLTNALRARPIARRHRPQQSSHSEVQNAQGTSDPNAVPYSAKLTFIPRSYSGTSHSCTLNVMLGNQSDQKLVDYDVELTIPTLFVGAVESPFVDRDISDMQSTVFRVPMPSNTPPPSVFPGQTRNILSFQYTVTINHVQDPALMAQQVESVIRFADGRTLNVSAPMRELHDAQIAYDLLQKVNERESQSRTAIAFVARSARRTWDAFVGGRGSDMKKHF